MVGWNNKRSGGNLDSKYYLHLQETSTAGAIIIRLQSPQLPHSAALLTGLEIYARYGIS